MENSFTTGLAEELHGAYKLHRYRQQTAGEDKVIKYIHSDSAVQDQKTLDYLKDTGNIVLLRHMFSGCKQYIRHKVCVS